MGQNLAQVKQTIKLVADVSNTLYKLIEEKEKKNIIVNFGINAIQVLANPAFYVFMVILFIVTYFIAYNHGKANAVNVIKRRLKYE